jgi:peptidoglycan hydrolase-like protein with peptidoglycan-binding domain
VPTTDLATPGPWLEARRRSRARRAETARRRRRLRLSRGGATALLAGMTLAAGAALAQDQTHSGGSSSTRPGGSVVALQKALGIPADGVYGPQTAAAVRAFQRNHGLAVDGVAGPATMGALGLSGSATTAPVTQRGTASGANAPLDRIARCESGGDPTAVSASGTYRGKYQFSRATWRAMGGSGDPSKAPEAEQDRRAAALLEARGTAPWPNCA